MRPPEWVIILLLRDVDVHRCVCLRLVSLYLIENTDRPVLVRQLKEAHSTRIGLVLQQNHGRKRRTYKGRTRLCLARMNEIIEHAQYSRRRNRGAPQLLIHVHNILPIVHTRCRGQFSTIYDCFSSVEYLEDTLV